MKRTIAILLAIITVSALLCACGKDSGKENDVISKDTADLIAVEQIELYPRTVNDEMQTQARFKVRNLSDEPVDAISIKLQVLNESGDAIATTSALIEDVDAGQAITKEGWYQLDCDYNEIATLKIKTYDFLESNGQGAFHNAVSYELSEPNVLTFSGETKPQDVSNTGLIYIWTLVK